MNLASIVIGTTTIPTPHLTQNVLAIIVCLVIGYVVWRWVKDGKLGMIAGIFIGLALSVTSLGPHLLIWLSYLTHGYL